MLIKAMNRKKGSAPASWLRDAILAIWIGPPKLCRTATSPLITCITDAPIKPTVRHTCFEVADYDALKAQFVRDGIPFREIEQEGNRWQILINDPDGNTLEFQRVTS